MLSGFQRFVPYNQITDATAVSRVFLERFVTLIRVNTDIHLQNNLKYYK